MRQKPSVMFLYLSVNDHSQWFLGCGEELGLKTCLGYFKTSQTTTREGTEDYELARRGGLRARGRVLALPALSLIPQ